jgi:hypothetical protein
MYSIFSELSHVHPAYIFLPIRPFIPKSCIFFFSVNPLSSVVLAFVYAELSCKLLVRARAFFIITWYLLSVCVSLMVLLLPLRNNFYLLLPPLSP